MILWIDFLSFLVTSSLQSWSLTKAVPGHPKINLVASSPNLLSGHVAQSNSTFWQYTCKSSFEGSYVGTSDASWFGTICVDGSTLAADVAAIVGSISIQKSKSSKMISNPWKHWWSSELRYQCKTPVKTKSTVCCQFPTSSVTSSFFPRSKTKRQVHHVEESALQTRWKPQASPQTKWLKLSHTTPSTGPPEPNSYFGITWCFPFWNNMWYPWMQIHNIYAYYPEVDHFVPETWLQFRRL